MKYTCILCLSFIALFIGCDKVRLTGQNDSSFEELNNLAKIYYNEKKLDSLSLVADRIISLTDGDSLSTEWGSALIYKGTVCDLQGRYDSAAHYMYGALRIAETINDNILLSRALNNLGILYFNMRNTEEAVSLYQRFLIIARNELKDSVYVCKALNNIGNAYATIDHDYNKATPYFEACVKVAEEIGDEEAYASAKLTLIQIQTEKEEFADALRNVREIRDRGVNHYYVDYTEAGIYKGLKEFDKAIVLYDKILQMKLNSREFVLAIYTELGDIYKEMGNLQAALDYKDKYQADRDSMHSLETHESIEVLKITYETEKKELVINSLEKEKSLLLWLATSGMLLLLLILLVLLFRQRIIRQKKEIAEQRISELEKEKQLIAVESLLNGENDERRRLSRELHDGLGGLLTMAKLNLGQLKEKLTNEIIHIDNVTALMDQSISEMRRMAHNLMPESLERFGLRPVLEEYCANSPKVNFYVYGTERRLSDKEEIHIYRIASELINNALKHAEATQINVQLIYSESSVSLTVQDNGTGFNTENIHEGLATVKSRTELLGADINIYSESKKGTEITIELKNNEI